jgi:hypothetical protein
MSFLQIFATFAFFSVNQLASIYMPIDNIFKFHHEYFQESKVSLLKTFIMLITSILESSEPFGLELRTFTHTSYLNMVQA